MIFKDIELDFDIFDADTADLYEAAVKATRAETTKKPGESLGDAIRRQCNAVFTFFDTLFGEGFHEELFSPQTNLVECIGTFRDFIKEVNGQKAVLDAMMKEVEAENAAAAPNRAARRAANKTVSQ